MVAAYSLFMAGKTGLGPAIPSSVSLGVRIRDSRNINPVGMPKSLINMAMVTD